MILVSNICFILHSLMMHHIWVAQLFVHSLSYWIFHCFGRSIKNRKQEAWLAEYHLASRSAAQFVRIL